MIAAQVKKCSLDENGNVVVETEYILTDGSKKIGHTRYNGFNFSREKIFIDIKTHCETLMKRVWSLKQCQTLINTSVDDLSYICDSAIVVVLPERKDTVTGATLPKVTITIDDK